MATNLLPSLIDLSNNPIQVLILKIGEVLVNESANQQAKAIAEGKDPEPYKMRVIADRFNPLDELKTNTTPLVSIEESDDSRLIESSGGHGKQRKLVSINIDCLGTGVAKQTDTGHRPADLDATERCRNLANLVNKILVLADLNNNLGLDRKYFNSMGIQSEQVLNVDFDSRQMQPTIAKRLVLQCRVTDTPVINEGVPLDSIVVDIERGDSGEIYTTMEFDFT